MPAAKRRRIYEGRLARTAQTRLRGQDVPAMREDVRCSRAQAEILQPAMRRECVDRPSPDTRAPGADGSACGPYLQRMRCEFRRSARLAGLLLETVFGAIAARKGADAELCRVRSRDPRNPAQRRDDMLAVVPRAKLEHAQQGTDSGTGTRTLSQAARHPRKF